MDPFKHARRREQVRKAQKTHRERRASYIKTIEAELSRLRANDAAHYADLAALKDTISQLKDLLRQHDIPLPPDLASSPRLSSPLVTVEIHTSTDQTHEIRTNFPPNYSSTYETEDILPWTTPSAPSSSATVTDSDANTSTAHDFSAGEESSSTLAAATSNMPVPVAHPQGLGATQVGIDFVLALEHICIIHHTFHEGGERDFSGHEMMLLSPIMSRSPAPPVQHTTPSGSCCPDGTSWQVPAIELERLLECADRLSLDGEITPVEIWWRIRRHPNFPSLTRDGLEALKVLLIPEVDCYHFGAIVNEERFEDLLRQVLGGSSQEN
ncbi:hypothetical protein PV10_04361 [Exophiala mesophila]|uniref:BZIP domain-containing protein n=1 Tax=Exophiala mesophila TaxID=212818 RepID=A0A0D1ZEJ3_EXOME|nr:uncharacterized protein PV10_04361 [Exophiala mesophila]KIV93122.1 hypothetical protein PV10_04361 [Exophiala mesophila]